MCHLGKILNVKWWLHIPNKSILEKSKLPRMYDILVQCNLKWGGQLNRLEDSRLPKQMLYSQLREGSCKTSWPKLRYKHIIKRNLEVMNIPLDNWQYRSKNWKKWRKKSTGHHRILWIWYDLSMLEILGLQFTVEWYSAWNSGFVMYNKIVLRQNVKYWVYGFKGLSCCDQEEFKTTWDYF